VKRDSKRAVGISPFSLSCEFSRDCSDGFKAYENEDDVTKDLAEFSLANAIFAALTEGYACEQSARCVSVVGVFSSYVTNYSCIVAMPWTMPPRMQRI
jgi:hypothetical protein